MKWLALVPLLFSLSLSHAGDGLSDKMKTLWLEIVGINSGTDNAEGLTAVRKKLIPEFEKLGFKTQILDAGQGHKVTVFRFPDSQPTVAFIGHLDTVFAKDSPFQKPTLEGEWIHGPGAQDMKGGVILMLDVLSELKGKEPLRQVEVLLNDDEETGSKFSSTILKEQCDGVHSALIFEGPVGSAESVVATQSGVNWLELTVHGQAAHAGVAHEDGINACVELSHKLVEISKLTDYRHGLTVNVGVIAGGTKPNVVCEEARAEIDIRYTTTSDLERTRKAIDRIAAKSTVYNGKLKRGTAAEIRELLRVPSLTSDVSNDLFLIAKDEARKIGMVLKGEHVGGVSDGNELAATGIKVLVGIGVYGQSPHTDQERADLASYGRRKALAVGLTRRLIN